MANKPLLFVDTNILLDFYRAGGGAGLTLLQHLWSVSDVLVITDQIEAEFLNNRRTVIASTLDKFPSITRFIPAYLADSKTAAKLERSISEVEKRVSSLEERLARISKDPATHDPVLRVVRRVFSKETPLSLKHATDDKKAEIFRAALQRFQRGFPPRKKQDNSIGDAINWEWLLYCAKARLSDVLLVSRDGDFGVSLEKTHYLNDWLCQEFKDRVSSRRNAQLIPSLAQALKQLAIKVTPAEEKEEQSIISKQNARQLYVSFENSPDTGLFPKFWPFLLKIVRDKYPMAAAYLTQAESADVNREVFTIRFPPEHADNANLLDNTSVHELIQVEMIRAFGRPFTVRFVVNGPPARMSPSSPIPRVGGRH
jgi:hypothetical protein